MRGLLHLGLRIAITGGLLLLLFEPSLFGLPVSLIPVSLGDLRAELGNFQSVSFWAWVGVALTLKAIAIGASITKWTLLLRAQVIQLPLGTLTAIFLMGRFFGTFLPGTIGLDGFRLYEVARRTGRLVESATAILFDKLAGFIALTLLVAMTLPIGYHALAQDQRIPPGVLSALVTLFGTAAVGALVLIGFPRVARPVVAVVASRLPARVGTLLGQVGLAAAAYEGRRRLIGAVLLCGVASHLATSLMYFATAMALATQSLGVGHVLFAAPIMIFGTVLGPSIGGEGIREAMFVYLLGSTVGPAKAFLASHLGFWVEGTFALAGGLIFLLSGNLRPRKADARLVPLVGLPPRAPEPRGRPL